MKFWNYLKYLARHKYYVSQECIKHGLIWRGLVHDLSKFRPQEFIPYMNYFYGRRPNGLPISITSKRDAAGYYKPTDTGDSKFDFAWLLHQKRNRHHWQWWTLPEDDGGLKLLEIQEPYLTEMICDWMGAGKAQGKHSPANDPYQETRKWWETNNHKMSIHPNTRKEIERRIGYTT